MDLEGLGGLDGFVLARSQRMAMLADLVEHVIGVDTHRHTHTAAGVQAVSSAVVDQVTCRLPRAATGSCCGSPTNRTVGGCGRSRAPAARALA